MSCLNKERIKSIIIILLIFIGLVQVGIQWGYQSQGTPTGFISGLFRPSNVKVSDADTREGLFKPGRLILSDGEKAHWILNEENSYYSLFWNEAKHALSEVVEGKVAISESDEEWIDIFEKRCYLIDFEYDINSDLLNWFLGVRGKSQDIPDVCELIIKPDIIDEKKIVIYIHTADKVYVSDEISTVREKSLNSIITSIKESEKYREYWTFGAGRINESLQADPDILYILDSPVYWPYTEFKAGAPSKGQKHDEVAEIILGNERGRYNTSIDSSGTLQFTNTNNIYKYYPAGYLNYQYLKDTDSSANRDIGEALLNAYNFIARINELASAHADLVLTHAEELQDKQGVYEFYFDYRLDGMPVTFNIEGSGMDSSEIKHGIVIKANSKRVLRCDCILKDIETNAKKNYCDRLFDLLNYSGESYTDIQNLKNMYVGYFFSNIDQNLLEPKLIVEMKNEIRAFVMPSEKGDQ
jgi:hypothetical protein